MLVPGTLLGRFMDTAFRDGCLTSTPEVDLFHNTFEISLLLFSLWNSDQCLLSFQHSLPTNYIQVYERRTA